MDRMDELNRELRSLRSEKLSQFSGGLIPTGKPVLGVKVPELRKIAKRLAKEDWKGFLDTCPEDYYEHQMLKAFVLGYAKGDLETILSYADNFIPHIQDWAVNDGFCQTFRIARKYPKRVWQWLLTYAGKEDEYSQRVVAVFMLSHFLTEEYIDDVLALLNTLTCPAYYTKMAVAWCAATAYAKFPEKTMEFLKNNTLDNWTYNKSIQKMLESFRVSEQDKKILRQMKR